MTPSTWIPLILTLVPLAHFAIVLTSREVPAWRTAERLAAAALALAAVGIAAAGATSTWGRLPWVGEGLLGDTTALRVDAASVVMLPLVSLLGLVIVRYSRSCLEGGSGQARYLRALASTLGFVSLLVLADHLLVLVGAWAGSSLSVHALLTHFGHRPGARLAARQKFWLGRASEVLFLGALAWLGQPAGSLSTDAVLGALPKAGIGTDVAALLVVGAVVLRTAQLPFHGWITRVMEAPTPVSALLHAGVVNLGGVVLVRLAPLLAASPAAQLVLVTVGGTTAVVGGLVMTTQPTAKSALAWSTIAQMGFLLVQCGLGLPALALLHLVAHSTYKAHAFLSASSTVERHEALAAVGPSPGWSAVGPLLVALVLAGAAWHALVLPLVPEPPQGPATARWIVLGVLVLAGGVVRLLLAQGAGWRTVRAVRLALAAGLWLDRSLPGLVSARPVQPPQKQEA